MVNKPEFFAVVITKNIRHEGDEHSKQYPGHGYPAYTESFKEFLKFTSENEFIAWVTDNDNVYDAYKCTPITISKETKYKFHY